MKFAAVVLYVPGLVGAPACGDVMKLQFETDDNGNIIDAKFKTFGCGSAIGKSRIQHKLSKISNIIILDKTSPTWNRRFTIEHCCDCIGGMHENNFQLRRLWPPNG